MTDMSRVIVNSGHPVAKLSFNDERHVNRYATMCTHKIGKKREEKRDKSHLSRVVPLHIRENDFYIYTTKMRQLTYLFYKIYFAVSTQNSPKLFLSFSLSFHRFYN